MSKVTAELLMAIVSLSKNHEIDFVSINSDHRSDQIHISISTSLDSRIEIVEDKLLTLFPTVVYTDEPYITRDRGEGVLTILQEINVGVENVHVTLHTHTTREKEMPSAPTESPREISHPDCTINVTKVESLLEPWYVEKIMTGGLENA